MGTFYRYTNLVTKGNLGLVPAGQDVVSQVDGQKYNFEAGRLIVYDPTTNKTLDALGIASAKEVRLGVGHNPMGGRMATEIRHLGGDDINLCRTGLDIKVAQPSCSTPYIVDFDFGCTFTGEDYMVSIDIDDWLRRSYFKEGTFGSLLYNLRTDVTSCTTCSEEENCTKLACQLASKINNDFIKHYPGTSRLGLNTAKPNTGIWAVQKFTNNVSFTIAQSNVAPSCGSGCAVKGLKSITASGQTPYIFTNVVDPSHPTQTLVEQLDSVVDQINIFLNGKGSAYLKKVDCCSYTIEINSCLTGITLSYHDDATTTGTSTPAFSSFVPNEECEGCAGSGTATFSCGIRLYVDPLELPCHCAYPDGNPPSYFGRTAKITAWGDGWNNTSYRTVVVQQGSLASGTGYEVQQNEFRQSNGGQGFDYPYGSYTADGRITMPLSSSAAARASVADCDDIYCIWSIVTENHLAGHPSSRIVHNAQTVNWLNVPRYDTVTVGAAQDVLEAMAGVGLCSRAEIECVDLDGYGS